MKKIIVLTLVSLLVLSGICFATPTRVVERADGGMSFIIAGDKFKSFDEEQAKQSDLKGRPYVDMDASELPSREYRNCWEIQNGKVKINNDKKKAQDNEIKELENAKDKLKELGISDAAIKRMLR